MNREEGMILFQRAASIFHLAVVAGLAFTPASGGAETLQAGSDRQEATISEKPQTEDTEASISLRDQLWESILSQAGSAPKPLSPMSWGESLELTFYNYYLTMLRQKPRKELTSSHPKPLLFAAGLYATGYWLSEPAHPYTGIFARKKTPCLIKLAAAWAPEKKGQITALFIKLFTANEQTIHLRLMYSWKPYRSTNPFSVHMNSIQPEPAPQSLSIIPYMLRAQERALSYRGLSRGLALRQNLNPLAAAGVEKQALTRAPYQIKLKPTRQAWEMGDRQSQKDFRQALNHKKCEGPLWAIYASDRVDLQPEEESESTEGDEQLIGWLKIDSALRTSLAGDQQLYFPLWEPSA